MESVVLIPAPGVGQLVHDLRMQYDPSAAAGIPPHVTLMFPFLPPSDLTEATIDSLERLIGATRAFQFSLTGVKQFEQGVVYLEPEPAEPFARLTREISRRFGILPFGGEFADTPVTHLTVATRGSASARKQLVNQLGDVVPIVVRAKEGWLVVGTNAGAWNIVRSMRLRD
ncbi:MAG TPA: 2'-5' RNA ligase family protein [Candidatus Dormibacteraeota bacterium]|nr:2'-5' RNA ligase family protein [Candidatus Dormibacteraeota bacterium]